MTAARHNRTRLALLGASAGVRAADKCMTVSASHWARAVEAFRQADAQLDALPPGASDEQYDALADIRYDAIMHLLLSPVPDLNALSLKIDLIVDEDAASLHDAAACFEVLEADGRRVCGRRSIKGQMTAIDIICDDCGGRNVRRDAWAEWDRDEQRWVLGEIFDYGHCHDCEGKSWLKEIPYAGSNP